MRTAKAVENGERSLSDEQVGQIYKKVGDITRRIKQGSLDFRKTWWLLQNYIEGLYYQNTLFGPYVVEVNYNRAIEDVVRDLEATRKLKFCKEYFINSECFPKQGWNIGKKRINLFLVRYAGEKSYAQRKAEIASSGLQNATVYELLAFIDQSREILSSYFSWAEISAFGQLSVGGSREGYHPILMSENLTAAEWSYGEFKPYSQPVELTLAFNEVPIG